MRRARDVREQLEGLMDRIEVEMVSSPGDNVAIRKVSATKAELTSAVFTHEQDMLYFTMLPPLAHRERVVYLPRPRAMCKLGFNCQGGDRPVWIRRLLLQYL